MERKTTKTVLQRTPPIELHRGDCLDVLRTLGVTVSSVVCDPPYGIAYRNKKCAGSTAIVNDERPFVWWMWDAVRLLSPAGALVCFCRWDVQEDFKRCIELAGLTVRSQWVWDRKVHGMGDTKKTLGPRHDVMWFATRPKFAFPDGRPTSIIADQSVPGATRIHPTEKPADLMRRIVRAVTPAGGTVLDPCMGSGATGECVRDGFGFIGVEIDQAFFEAASKRIRKAIRERANGS